MSQIELVNDYISECSPLLDTIVESVFMMMGAGDAKDEYLDKIFRAFHTIKSNSGIIDKSELSEICHICEDALAVIRDDKKEIDNDLISALMLVIDYLNDSFIRLDADTELVPIDSSILFSIARFIEK